MTEAEKERAAVLPWTPKTKVVWQDWIWGPYVLFKNTFDGQWHVRYASCVLFTAHTLQEAMAFVEGREAARAEHLKEGR